MSRINSQQLSVYRQKQRQLIEKLDRVSSRCLFDDSIIRGTPNEVYRKCSKANCKCANDLSQRHGPYRVIQVVRDGKQRQIPLRKDEVELWELVKRYQFQMEKYSELKILCFELQELFMAVIEKRLKELPR